MPQLAFQLDALVLQMSILNLEVLHRPLKELHCGAMLLLPLLSDLLLVHHDRVGLLLEQLMSLPHLHH